MRPRGPAPRRWTPILVFVAVFLATLGVLNVHQQLHFSSKPAKSSTGGAQVRLLSQAGAGGSGAAVQAAGAAVQAASAAPAHPAPRPPAPLGGEVYPEFKPVEDVNIAVMTGHFFGNDFGGCCLSARPTP